MKLQQVKLDPFEESRSDRQEDEQPDKSNLLDDTAQQEADEAHDIVDDLARRSQSSNSSNDHTYNPYSFKRLQDAIFKKKEVLTQAKQVSKTMKPEPLVEAK